MSSSADAPARAQGRTSPSPSPATTKGLLSRVGATGGWWRRSVATAWMSVLIGLSVAVVYFTVWGGPARPTTPADVGSGALRLFAVWCLAFLPGWLYVRFLGQRAGALWCEYVASLHRLGIDRPQFLPKPPIASPYYDAWREGGGPALEHHENLYKQKFAAYYGRWVADSKMHENIAVRSETLFPVFLATAVFAAAWTATLWDPRFVAHPGSVWDVLKFGFVGAYAFIAQSLVRRYFQSDLRPSAYATAVVRVVVVLLTVATVHQIIRVGDLRAEAATAFVIGFFPLVGLQALQRTAATVLRVAVPQLSPQYPLNQLDGLNLWYESRLVEEGIEDMENLATANIVDVILHTRVPVGRLVDWIDQAHLYLHLDRTERGARERRVAAKNNSAAGGSSVSERVSGSVGPGNRAGTQTRTALRQLGIRNATDLIKAFPPEQIDPTAEMSGRLTAAFARLEADGIDVEQIRTLVRVIDEDTGLTPVWNWQTSGPVPREAIRVPRSRRHAADQVVSLHHAAPLVPAGRQGEAAESKEPDR